MSRRYIEFVDIRDPYWYELERILLRFGFLDAANHLNKIKEPFNFRNAVHTWNNYPASMAYWHSGENKVT